jgi:hypothetical protein
MEVFKKAIKSAPLSAIAATIQRDHDNQGKKVHFGAVPYLSAMRTLHDMKSTYICESADSIVNYLLSNLGQWRGEVAKVVKNELRDRIANHYKTNPV